MLIVLWALSSADPCFVGVMMLDGCKGWALEIWDIHIMLTTSRYAAMMSGQSMYRLSMRLVSRNAVNSGRSARNLSVNTTDVI